MMFRSTLAEVVSVASPGSSDGGSEPQAIVIVWSAASLPLPPPEPLLELLLPPPQPAATSAATATRRAASTIELRVRIWWSSLRHAAGLGAGRVVTTKRRCSTMRPRKTLVSGRKAQDLAI